MLKKLLPLSGLPFIVLAGCNSAPSVGKAIAAEPELRGTWKMDMGDSVKGDKNDPAAQLGSAFASMFMNVKLKFMNGDRFKLSMMSIPIEGHFTLDGNHLKLTAEKVAGKTPEEIKKMEKDNPQAQKMQVGDLSAPMDAELSADKKSITLHSTKSLMQNGGKPEDMVFKKVEEKPVQDKLQSPAEKMVAGTWEGSMDLKEKPNMSAEDKQKMELAKSMMNNVELVLRRDNTFAMDMVVHIEGTWRIVGKQIELSPMSTGEMKATTTSGKPLMMDVSPDSKTLTVSDPQAGTLTFTREDE